MKIKKLSKKELETLQDVLTSEGVSLVYYQVTTEVTVYIRDNKPTLKKSHLKIMLKEPNLDFEKSRNLTSLIRDKLDFQEVTILRTKFSN